MNDIEISTRDHVEGKKIVRELGLVMGNAIESSTPPWDRKMLARTRERAKDRMIEKAKEAGANAILGAMFSAEQIAHGAMEFLAYGTAVVVEDI